MNKRYVPNDPVDDANDTMFDVGEFGCTFTETKADTPPKKPRKRKKKPAAVPNDKT